MAACPRQAYLSLKSGYSILCKFLHVVEHEHPRIIFLSPVGESTHADPDSLEHTVASQLVHDEWGLHLAGLLVGVGHKATHKVGLAGIESGHQLNQGDEVDRGDSLAATLLLLLAVVLGGCCGLAGMVWTQNSYLLHILWNLPSHRRTSRASVDWLFMTSTTESLTGSLFFSSQLVTL